MTTIRISASALKTFKECPRAWYRQHVLRIEREQKSYLTKGDDFDAAIRQHVEGAVPTPATELAARQLHAVRVGGRLPAGRGNAQFKYLVSAGDGILVTGAADVRDERIEPGGLVRVIKDTKTTSDRGPNRGADAQRPAYALTDERTPGGNNRPLALDWQARLYAWCEFTMADAGTAPAIALVEAEWLYVSKDKSPAHWASKAVFRREDTLAWFEAEIRPIALRMRELAESGLPDSGVGANPDSCRRCLVAVGCAPFDGAQVHGAFVPLRKAGSGMAFDVSKLRGGAAAPVEALSEVVTVPAESDSSKWSFDRREDADLFGRDIHAAADLESALAASVEAVAINRPKAATPPTAGLAVPATEAEPASVCTGPSAQASAPPSATSAATADAGETDAAALEVSTIEGPGAAYLALEFVNEPTPGSAAEASVQSEFGESDAEPVAGMQPRKRRARKAEAPADANALIVAELRANLAQQSDMLDRLAKALGVAS